MGMMRMNEHQGIAQPKPPYYKSTSTQETESVQPQGNHSTLVQSLSNRYSK